MTYISSMQKVNVRISAFLDMIAWSEGTRSDVHSLTKMDGYDVIVTGSDGKEIFDDLSMHPFSNGRPPKHVTGTLYSSASGRYQFLRTHWGHYKDVLNLPDFGPLSQDLWAIQLIRERRAIDLILHNEISEAILQCANIWASFPGAGYGQPEHNLKDLIDIYNDSLRKQESSEMISNYENDKMYCNLQEIHYILGKISRDVKSAKSTLEKKLLQPIVD